MIPLFPFFLRRVGGGRASLLTQNNVVKYSNVSLNEKRTQRKQFSECWVLFNVDTVTTCDVVWKWIYIDNTFIMSNVEPLCVLNSMPLILQYKPENIWNTCMGKQACLQEVTNERTACYRVPQSSLFWF